MALDLYPHGRRVSGAGKGRKPIEAGLVHRLDTDTEGLILVALTQETFDYFLDIQNKGLLLKEYYALCTPGVLPPPGFSRFPFPDISTGSCLESRFRAFGPKGREVRPVPLPPPAADTALEISAGKASRTAPGIYRTDILSLSVAGERLEVTCRLSRGFRHQIRCHLAWSGNPIAGDRVYNRNYNEEALELHACALEFPEPGSGKSRRITCPPASVF
jgi:23S rRNA pseudouridine1911/1915/1917 synthase